MENKPSLESAPQWMWRVLIVVCILVVFMFVRKTHNKLNLETAETTTTQTKKSGWEFDHKITISFTGKYDAIYRNVTPGTKTSSMANDDFVVKNKMGEEYIIRKGEDMFRSLGNTTNNNELQFKSLNGETGSFDIFFYN